MSLEGRRYALQSAAAAAAVAAAAVVAAAALAQALALAVKVAGLMLRQLQAHAKMQRKSSKGQRLPW